jgi:hypothetical protein
MTRWIKGISRADWIAAGLTPRYFDMFAAGKVTGAWYDYTDPSNIRLRGYMLGGKAGLLLAEGSCEEVTEAFSTLAIFGFPLHSHPDCPHTTGTV